jgi:hypothetical protein
LIVFFAAIREILKKEIYGRDKQNYVPAQKCLKRNDEGTSAIGQNQ